MEAEQTARSNYYLIKNKGMYYDENKYIDQKKMISGKSEREWWD